MSEVLPSASISKPSDLPRLRGLASVLTRVQAGGTSGWDHLRRREPEALLRLGVSTPESAVAVFASADPHETRKPYTSWLVRTYLRGGFRLEDLGKAKETLELFERVKPRMAVEDRDIGRYATLGALWKAIDPLLPKSDADDEATWPVSKRQAETKLRRRVMRATNILLERDDGFVMAIPMTEEAACWWGRGTRWCTAAREDNQFDTYHAEAPLVVLRWADGAKWQAWMKPGDVQLMDESDERPCESAMTARWEDLEHVILAMVRHSGDALQRLPKALRTAEICLETA